MTRLNRQSSEVYVRTALRKNLTSVVADLMDKVKWLELIPSGGFVILKPNFCDYRSDRIEDANTSFPFIEAVCEVLSSRAGRIVIVEADGLRYKIETVYRMMGMERLTRRYGVQLMNLTTDRVKKFSEPLLEDFGLPAIFSECDCFMTLPKLKTHALTYFTGALKNQWGCIPRPDRILLHKHIQNLIPRINQLLSPRLAIMDALVAMEGRGPTNGIRRDLSLLLASRDLVALDAAAMRLVGLDPKKAKHVVNAASIGVGRIDDIHVDGDDFGFIKPFVPARMEWTLLLMNYLARYRPFVYHILLDTNLFSIGKRMAMWLRKWQLS